MPEQKTDNALKSAISELKEFAFQNQTNNTETISLVCEIESLVEKLEKRANKFNFAPPVASNNLNTVLVQTTSAIIPAIT